jgi:nitrobindin-like protein
MTNRRPQRLMAAAVSAVAALAATAAMVGGQQSSAAADPFELIAFMIGRWEGTSEGQPGKATVRRAYERALNSRFIRVHNRSEYPPQEKNPKGEIHEDEGFFSFDRNRKRLVLRQFHAEGFVNQYVQEPDSTLAFTSESIENIPAGWRARETYIVHGPDEFDEIFELAEPGKPFQVYSRARLKRVN